MKSKGIAMKRIFGMATAQEENNSVSAKFEKYLSKELAYDLLRVHGNIIIFFSKKDGWIGANKAFFDLFKFEDMDDFLEYHSSVRELFFSESETIFVGDDNGWVEYIRKRKNGEFKVSIRINEEVRVFRVYVTHSFAFKELFIVEFDDITEVEQTRKKAQQLENLKTKFLANISHEFRTPMNAILGFIELLSQTKLTNIQKNYLQILERSSESLMANIEALLDLSQLQSSKLRLNNNYVDIMKSIEALVRHFTFMINESAKHFYVYIDPALPQEVFTDAKKIEQVLSALLQHSLNQTQRGSKIYLDVRAIRENENGTYDIGFSVRHDGKGLTPKEIEAIRNAFDSTLESSLGIGLTLANEFVKLLGSQLEIRSDLASGTRFSFIMRLKFNEKRKYAYFNKRRAKVLMLDETKQDDYEYLLRYFKAYGFHVHKAQKIDEYLYKDADFVYVIASQKELSWVDELQRVHKTKPLVYVQPMGSRMHKKYLQLMDEVIREPLLPSAFYNHLLHINDLEVDVVPKEEMKLRKNLYALVVEDNVINQKLIELILKNRGISIAIASDGQEAVEMAKKEKYDIIFMDIDMPKKNGIAATREIKKSGLNTNTPVVALTAMALEGDREKLLQSGLDGYMSKPIKKEELSAILNRYFK